MYGNTKTRGGSMSIAYYELLKKTLGSMGIKNPEKYLAPETNPLDIQTAEDKAMTGDYQALVDYANAQSQQTSAMQTGMALGGALGAGTAAYYPYQTGTVTTNSGSWQVPQGNYATISAADVETICRTVMKEMIAELVDKLSVDGIHIPIEELREHLKEDENNLSSLATAARMMKSAV
jgi:hypothetical protein